MTAEEKKIVDGLRALASAIELGVVLARGYSIEQGIDRRRVRLVFDVQQIEPVNYEERVDL